MFSEEKIIASLASLKAKRKYPAYPGEILTALRRPKNVLEKLKRVLRSMGQNGTLIPSRRGKFRAYMLAGEDVRYSRNPDEKLKFELLAEIEILKAQLLQVAAEAKESSEVVRAVAAEAAGASGEDLESLDRRVFETIRRIARHRTSRCVHIREIREVLSDIPGSELDQSLERLGTSWKLELQPVQDATKLTEKQRKTALRVSDGTMVCTVAAPAD